MTTHTEPTIYSLGGNAPARIAKRYLLATRPMFLTASLLSVVVGSSYGAWQSGQLDAYVAVLALCTIACLHAAFNVLNDVFDELNGTDRVNRQRIYPFTGGSRFIQNGVLSVQQMRHWALLLLFIASLLGILLLIDKGLPILIFGVSGIVLGFFYSAPPVHLASRGLGEFAVATGFGLLPVTGAVWLQSGAFDLQTLLLSIPVSCWVANILIINELPDVEADTVADKRTLVVRLGTATTRHLYTGLSILAFLSIALAAGLHWLSYWSPLLPAGLLLLGIRSARQITSAPTKNGRTQQAIQQTIAIHALGCIWLAVVLWI